MTVYAYRLHDRMTEDDPELATLMYASDCSGPWHDMVSGHPEWCEEILDALLLWEQTQDRKRREEMARIRKELEAEWAASQYPPTSTNVNDG